MLQSTHVHSMLWHFYVSLTKKSLKWKLFVAMCRQWNIAIFVHIWMWWFPVQDWSLWVTAAFSFGSLLAEAWLWPPNLPAPATFSTSVPNIITAHITCTILLYFNVGCLFWPIQIDRYSESLFQEHELTGLLMLGSTPLILFAIYFLNKLNPNFIPKEVKLWISCISSCLCHVWCHLTAGKNPTFSFCPVLPTAQPGNKVNSKTITSCIVILVMTAANIWSCKNTLVYCCERWVNSIQDCTAETWVDYCQLGEDCSFSMEILKLQRSCCLLSLWYSAPCSGPQFIILFGVRAVNCAHWQTCKHK